MRWFVWLLFFSLTVNYVRCASTIENATVNPAANKVKSCTLTNITDLQQIIKSACDSNIAYLIIRTSQFRVFPRIFDNFQNLLSVDVSSAGIQSIESTTFNSAIHLNVLEMGKSNMHTLVSNLFTHVNNLTSLGISNSSIEIVENFAFNGLSNLYTLDLSGNKILSLDRQLFQPLTRLKTIRLNDNKIEVISRDLFMHNSQLIEVYLSNNDIISVDPDSFTNCKLMSLDLGSNQLSQLDLTAIKHLKELNINNNQLDVLHVPSAVERLHAKNNSITVIHSDENNSLEWLYLSSNHFRNISDLVHFTKLEFLDLSSNHLQNFPFAAVKALTQLKELQLSGNKLPEINAEDVVTNLPKLHFIELYTKHWSRSFVDQLNDDLKSHNVRMSQDQNDMPDDDSSVIPSTRPMPVTPRTTVYPAFTTQSPNTRNVEQQLNEIRKQLSELEYKVGANAEMDSKKIDNSLADVREQLMKSNAANDAKLEVLRSSFKVYEVLVIMMAACVTVFVVYKLVIHSRRMLNGMNYRRTQSSDEIFSEQDL